MESLKSQPRRQFIQNVSQSLVLAIFTPAFIIPMLSSCQSGKNLFHKHWQTMGSHAHLLIHHPDWDTHHERTLKQIAHQAVRISLELHQQLTLFDSSHLTQLNLQGHEKEVLCPGSIIQLVKQSQQIHEKTKGYFDPTVFGLMNLMKSYYTHVADHPSDSLLQLILEGVRMEYVCVNESNQSIHFEHRYTGIDLNGIAQGFAVDKIKEYLLQEGVKNFLINLSGDIYAHGAFDTPNGWYIYLKGNPEALDPFEQKILVSNQAIATSGNVNQQERNTYPAFSHLLNPLNGKSVNEWYSTTVIAYSATNADAWSTALYVGKKGVIQEQIQNQGFLAIWIDTKNEVTSSHI